MPAAVEHRLAGLDLKLPLSTTVYFFVWPGHRQRHRSPKAKIFYLSMSKQAEQQHIKGIYSKAVDHAAYFSVEHFQLTRQKNGNNSADDSTSTFMLEPYGTRQSCHRRGVVAESQYPRHGGTCTYITLRAHRTGAAEAPARFSPHFSSRR